METLTVSVNSDIFASVGRVFCRCMGQLPVVLIMNIQSSWIFKRQGGFL